MQGMLTGHSLARYTYALLGGLILVSILLFAPTVAADSVDPIDPQEAACIGAGNYWDGEECLDEPGGETGQEGVEGLLINIAEILLLLIGFIAVVMLIIGGIRYIISSGDSSAVEGAKKTILYALIGIVVAFASYAIVNFLVTGFQEDGIEQLEDQEGLSLRTETGLQSTAETIYEEESI